MTRLRMLMCGFALTAVAAAAASRIEHRSGTASPRGIAVPQPLSSRALESEEVPAGFDLLAPRPLSGEYQVLLRRSLFARPRAIGPAGDDAAADPQPPKQSHLVFLGTMKVGSRAMASLEDVEQGRQTWVTPGDLLPDGNRVREIALDYLVIEKEGARRRVELGSNMDGAPVSVADSGAANSPTGLPVLTDEPDDAGPETPE